MVARLVRDQEAMGSSPVTSTIKGVRQMMSNPFFLSKISVPAIGTPLLITDYFLQKQVGFCRVKTHSTDAPYKRAISKKVKKHLFDNQ